jgi:hypothetical protein
MPLTFAAVKAKEMPEEIKLGNGDTATIRSDLTYSDRKWWRIEVDKTRRANGTGRPAETKVNPSNPAEMIEVPAVPPELTMEDNIVLVEALTARLLTASSVPGIIPWTPEAAEALSRSHGLEAVDAIEDAVIVQMNRLNGVAGPKKASSGGSGNTSPDATPSPLPA